MEKEGAWFNQPMIPNRPKRITKGSIRKLERMNTQGYRYSRARIKDPKTGQTLKFSTYAKNKRSEASKKGWITHRKKEEPADGERINRLDSIMQEFMLGAGGKIPARQEYLDMIAEIRSDVMRVYNMWMNMLDETNDPDKYDSLSKSIIAHESEIAYSVEVTIEDSDAYTVSLHIEKIETALRAISTTANFSVLDVEEAALLQDQLE